MSLPECRRRRGRVWRCCQRQAPSWFSVVTRPSHYTPRDQPSSRIPNWPPGSNRGTGLIFSQLHITHFTISIHLLWHTTPLVQHYFGVQQNYFLRVQQTTSNVVQNQLSTISALPIVQWYSTMVSLSTHVYIRADDKVVRAGIREIYMSKSASSHSFQED